MNEHHETLGKHAKHLEHAPNTRRIVWAVLLVAILFVLRLPDLIVAIRWW